MRARVTSIVLLVALSCGGAMAAEAKNYAYFFLQGKISAAEGARGGLPGATVQLLGADASTFQAVTGADGVFRFDRLPVQRYELTVTGPGGKVVRSFEEIDPAAPSRRRLVLRMGEGEPASTVVSAAGPETLEVEFSERAPRWKRFWRQFGIFLGAAAVLAL